MNWNRIGTYFLCLAGSLLAGLMAYTLFFVGWRTDLGGDDPDRGPVGRAARVAIFLPNGRDWFDFRQALAACAAKGLLRLVASADDALIIESTRTARRLQLDRHDVRGVTDTRAEVGRLGDQQPRPIAVVGSTTTVLTVALAEPLRDEGAAGPVLLLPWATAVMVQRSGPGKEEAQRELVPLIEVNSGRTFRFCPNNRRLADSVVDCLVARDEGRLPGRVFLVVDPFDPYSNDLADCFHRAIRARQPDVEIIERADAVDLPSFARPLHREPEPSPAEMDLANAIVSSGEQAEGRTTWVVLPLQDQPARRLIAALRRRVAWRGATGGMLRVVCGDAIERRALDDLAGLGGLVLWCASTSSSQPTGQGVGDDTQALAEIASALVWAVDQTSAAPTPTEIRDALRRINFAADDPAAFGRALAFDSNGERRGDPERVLEVRADARRPVEFARQTDGSWHQAIPPSQAGRR